MRHAISWLAALVVPVLLLTGPAVAQKKDRDLEKSNDVKMVKAGVLVGKIMAVYEDKKKLRVQVQVPKLNPGAINSIVSAQQQMARATTIQGRIQAQQALLRAQQQLYTMQPQDFELEATDDVVVRTIKPREEFDEKGKIKKLSKKELAELKGPDKKLIGYKAEFSDLQTEQIIQVTLVKKKGAKPVVRPKKGKAKDLDADIDVLADNLPQVSRIVILRDPPPAK